MLDGLKAMRSSSGESSWKEFGVLCFRGQRNTDQVGTEHSAVEEPSWVDLWSRAIEAEFGFWNETVKARSHAVGFDEILKKQEKLAPSQHSISLALRHGLWKAVMSVGAVPASAGMATAGTWRALSEKTRWQAGLLAQWAENTAGQVEMRKKVVRALRGFKARKGIKPQIICAHGLTCLPVYDALIRPENQHLGEGIILITLASPLGNPLVRSVFGGRLMMPPVAWWFNLTNPADDSLSAPLQTVSSTHSRGGNKAGGASTAASGTEAPAPTFREILTPFSNPSDQDPSPEQYLQHQNARFGMWRILAGTSPMPYDTVSQDAWLEWDKKVSASALPGGKGRRALARPKEDWKALVIGINDYPDPAHRLSGCINDAYLVSRFLQNRGFKAGDIRLLLNERATASQIRDRLEWLLKDAPPDSTRILYYSGHGAQIASYGLGETIDALDECLVPYDFDWSIEKAVTDDWFYDLYSQLSYEVNFVAFFDCCHAGGISRDGVRHRGLSPPADVLHREMEWSPKKQRWDRKNRESYLQGQKQESADGPLQTRKIGKADPLRTKLVKNQSRFEKLYGHKGPFEPVIFKACKESEVAEEIHEGSVTYGVFTYALASVLRALPDAPPTALADRFSANKLAEHVAEKIRELRFRQTPDVDGPDHVLKEPLEVGRRSR